MSTICQFTPPGWLQQFALSLQGQRYGDDNAKSALAVALSALSINNGGGPFGAAIFDAAGRVVSVGCNLVLPGQSSLWHAEMVAILLAQQHFGSFDLGSHCLQLSTSCEPCVMCIGGVLWSGVRRVVCAATDADARAIGFDEGPKPPRWTEEFRHRGIEVVTGVARETAVAELQRYAIGGGAIYNASR